MAYFGEEVSSQLVALESPKSACVSDMCMCACACEGVCVRARVCDCSGLVSKEPTSQLRELGLQSFFHPQSMATVNYGSLSKSFCHTWEPPISTHSHPCVCVCVCVCEREMVVSAAAD